jgi:transcriptional regulator GlxA family with amidase domain
MPSRRRAAVDALVVALPETSGSALYGMVDVLSATGMLWRQLSGDAAGASLIRPRVVSLRTRPFRCGNGIPVSPDVGIREDLEAEIVILPELWLSPDDDMRGRYPAMIDWLRRRHRAGSFLYSACSGSVLLAATGLLDGREATSHWGYQDLFRTRYPEVRFRPEPNLVFADRSGRIVTAGGATSWHDLAIHIVSRHCSPGEALRRVSFPMPIWRAGNRTPTRPSDARRHGSRSTFCRPTSSPERLRRPGSRNEA